MLSGIGQRHSWAVRVRSSTSAACRRVTRIDADGDST